MGFMDNVKGFAAKVGTTVEKGAKSVTDNSKKMAEKSKVKKEINQLEAAINTAYISIGKKYFELHSAEPAEDFKDDVEKIISSTERLEKFRLLLASMDDKQPCANCGAEVSKDQKFCDKCGSKVEFVEPPVIEGYNDQVPEAASETEIIEVEALPEKKTCPSCGAELDADHSFCDQCGTKLV